MSRYYRTCPECGANLDPGEICDCKNVSRPALNPPDGHTTNDKEAHLEHGELYHE